MVFQDQLNIIAGSLDNLWLGFLGFTGNFIPALIIFVFGLAIAAVLGSLVEKILVAVRLDQFLVSLGLMPYFDRAGIKLRAARFLGQLVNWFLIIAFLVAASDQLRLYEFSRFLRDVLGFFPNVFAAVLIMLATVVAANFLRRIVIASVKSAQLHGAHFLGMLTWWVVIIFGLVAVLDQFQIAGILNTVVTGIIAMAALAGGLAFGLGGKDFAADLLAKLKDRS